MILMIVFALLFLCVFALWGRYRRLGLVLCLLSLGLLWLGSSAWFPNQLLTRLQKPYLQEPVLHWKKNNLMVLLGAGVTRRPDGRVVPSFFAYGRLYKTAALYHACRAHHQHCTVLISGGDPLHTGQSEAKTYAQALEQLDVPSRDVLQEPNSRNTYENAHFTQRLIEQQPHAFDQILLVTSGFHLTRALKYFQHFGVHPIPILADSLYPLPIAQPLAYQLASTELALHEILSLF